METFDYQPRTRLLFGEGVLQRLPEVIQELDGRRILLVTDPGIEEAGHADRVERLLRGPDRRVLRFDRVRENPDTRCVDACVEAARGFDPDLLVGLGGGSAMDTAKGANFILTNGGRMIDYQGVGKARQPMLPMVAIPTTAGTGSECQSAALISDAVTHQKMACLDPNAAPRAALLDPELTLSMPQRVTVCTGLDALGHAIEALVTRRRNPMSILYARGAFRQLWLAFPRVLEEPDDLDARGRMLVGAAWAGMAVELSMLGAAHAAANPLTAHHGVVHGHAVALMLPHVVRLNGADPATAEAYRAVAPEVVPEKAAERLAAAEVVDALALGLERLIDLGRVPRSLRALGLRENQLAPLAAEAAAQWTARFNPRPVGAADFERLYRAAWEA